MSNKLRFWLTSLFVLQLLIAAGLFVSDQSIRLDQTEKLLLSENKQQVNKILIESADKKITLAKGSNGWSLPELDGLPADEIKLSKTLDKLLELRTTWPVATTTGSHQRFKVADDSFERRIKLYRDDELIGDLILGSSPGYKKVHARVANNQSVYALALNVYDFPVKDDYWMDNQLLAAKQVTAIRGPDYVLKKEGDNWDVLAASNQDAELKAKVDENKVKQLAEALTTLRVTGLADKQVEFPPEKAIAVDADGPKDWHYQFLENDGRYYVKRDDTARVFTVSQYDFKRIASIDLAKLLQADTDEGATKTDSTDEVKPSNDNS